jgi:hypothetical protein
LFLSREGKKKLKKALLSLSMLITQRKKQLVKTLGPEQGKRLTHLHATGVTLQILEGTAPLFVDLIRLEGGMAIRRDAGWGSRFFGWSDDELGQVTFELDEAAGQGHIFWQQADQKLTFGFQAERWKEVEAFFSVYQVIAREDESRVPLSDEKRLHDLLGKSGTTPDTDPAWGRFLWWLGVVLLLGFLYIMIRWLWQDEGAESYFLWRTLAILGVLGIGYFFLQPGAKHRQKDARTALEQDARPPVLYLRSFMDDEADSQDTPPMINPLGKMISDEQLLVDALKAVGPVICLGRQGEELPPLGAHRQYVADDHEQQLFIRNGLGCLGFQIQPVHQSFQSTGLQKRHGRLARGQIIQPRSGREMPENQGVLGFPAIDQINGVAVKDAHIHVQVGFLVNFVHQGLDQFHQFGPLQKRIRQGHGANAQLV